MERTGMDQRISRRTFLQGTGAAALAFGLASHSSLAQGTPVASPVAGGPPLALWNESPVRTALIDFVTATTTEGSPDYLDPVDRIAVFDNDGTLWCEQPAYVQLIFALDQVKALFGQHPEWANEEPYKSAVAGDIPGLLAQGDYATLTIMNLSHAGISPDDYIAMVADWLATTKHPTLDRLYTELVYSPMVELLGCLRDNGYQTWIVSGGGVEFIRAFSEPAYDIPLNQIVGSTIETEYAVIDATPTLTRIDQVSFIANGPGKPTGISHAIGRQPALAFGNSDGDYQMLQYTTAGSGPRMGLLLHHDDAEREFAYDRDSIIGRLDHGLNDAAANGWHIVSMKDDFAEVFPPA
jgi:phosphoserine phosphatase